MSTHTPGLDTLMQGIEPDHRIDETTAAIRITATRAKPGASNAGKVWTGVGYAHENSYHGREMVRDDDGIAIKTDEDDIDTALNVSLWTVLDILADAVDLRYVSGIYDPICHLHVCFASGRIVDVEPWPDTPGDWDGVLDRIHDLEAID